MLQETITRDLPARRWQDYVVPQCWESFTEDDHAVWDLLFARQVELLGSRVVSPFLDGLDLLQLSHPGVPDVEGLNELLDAANGMAGRGGAGVGAGRHLLRHAGRAHFPCRQLHPHAPAARLPRSAGLLPRHVRPHPDARPSRLRGNGASMSGGSARSPARPAKASGWRASTGIPSSSASRANMAS